MGRSTILIVEDNDELKSFLSLCLEGDYELFLAADGAEGLQKAFENIPELIITDVAMPLMDGHEFCRIVKNDERTSHIPVIMLTAKVELEEQVTGIESGADLYLTKPFSIKLLQSYIKNLLKTKEQIRHYYTQKVLLEPLDVDLGNVDRKFMERLMNIINANLGNADFHIHDLARAMNMSTAVLYKKFNALSQVSIGEFIKSLRLKRAAFLLIEPGALNISEIAWAVGFSDRKYFSKEFKKAFGCTPSAYVEKTADRD
ncbi:MAG: DNA-binding response regulator [Sphingobacteriales bacterium 41-5]|nr:MAG: DNA-binding response regulator [Sphingobacteriales bacterium 41-5]